MAQDRYGLDVTTGSQRALDLYSDALDRALAQRSGSEDLLCEALDEDEDFALAWALLGLQQRGAGDITGGNQSINRARSLSARLSERERSHLAVLDRFIALDVLACEAAIDEHLGQWPLDATVVMQSHFLYNIFDWRPDRDVRMLALTERVAPAYGDDWFMASERAFAVEEAGDHDRARDLAEQALEGNPQSGRAAHGMSHALLEGGELEAGNRWLSEWLGGWDQESSFGCHLWWHLALFRLAQGDDAGAADVMRQIWAYRGTAVGVATDAPSLAWRLHLDGTTDPVSWDAMAELPDRPGFTFGNAHRALVLAGLADADGLRAYAETLGDLAATGHPTAGACGRFASGLAAFVAGDHRAAASAMLEIAPGLRAFGGSHAQTEVFDDTVVAVLAGAGAAAAARLRTRLERRPSVRDERWIARL